MPGSSFGDLFKITTFGESHGGAVGVVIDGCPSGLNLTEADIQPELDRRKPGQSKITTPRKEEDEIKIYSGVFEGKTTGTPIMIMAVNKDMRPQDYSELSKLYRPSHADFTYEKKYAVRDYRGSGRASARETLARVAAGAIAKKFLKEKLQIEILSYVEQIHHLKTSISPSKVTLEAIEANIVRCPDAKLAEEMITFVESIRDQGDSVGGIIRGVIKNLPIGLGEPVFDRFSAELGKAMLSINAVKGFDFGSGFDCVNYKGSEHNDPFRIGGDGQVVIEKNQAGGTLGGITTGAPVEFRVAFKPVATISKSQDTVNQANQEVKLEATGRHDPCVLPRAVPIVDAMSAIVVLDFYLKHRAFDDLV